MPLARMGNNIGREQVWRCPSMTPKVAIPEKRSEPRLTNGFLGQTLLLKRDFDRLSHFGMVHARDQETKIERAR